MANCQTDTPRTNLNLNTRRQEYVRKRANNTIHLPPSYGCFINIYTSENSLFWFEFEPLGVTKRVKFDAPPACFVTPACFVITWLHVLSPWF